MHKKMTSRHEDNLFVYLLSAEIDPSLLLHLAVSGLIIAQNSCTVYLNDLLFQRVLSPFAKRLGATLPEQELKRGTAQLLKFCRSDPSDFLRSTTERLAGIHSILVPHLTPETASQLDEDLKTEAPHFSKFFQAVTTRLKKEIPPVSPKAFVCGMKKDFTITEYAKHKGAWGEHIPFFFQTYNQIINKNGDSEYEEGSSTFFIFRTAPDGLRTVIHCLLEEFVCVHVPGRPVKGSKVMGVNELTLPEMLCNPILDCEIKASFFGGRLKFEEIDESLRTCLSKILSFWDSEGILPSPCLVSVGVKTKSRVLPGGDHKVSMHLIPHIIATRSLHEAAQKAFLDHTDGGVANRDLIKLAKEQAKANHGVLPDKHPISHLESWDFKAFSNGFAVHGSKKRRTDPYSEYAGIRIYVAGSEMEFQPCPILQNRDRLDPDNMLQLLWMQCYTTPKFVEGGSYPVSYSDAFVRQRPTVFSFIACIGIRTHSPLFGARKKLWFAPPGLPARASPAPSQLPAPNTCRSGPSQFSERLQRGRVGAYVNVPTATPRCERPCQNQPEGQSLCATTGTYVRKAL